MEQNNSKKALLLWKNRLHTIYVNEISCINDGVSLPDSQHPVITFVNGVINEWPGRIWKIVKNHQEYYDGTAFIIDELIATKWSNVESVEVECSDRVEFQECITLTGDIMAQIFFHTDDDGKLVDFHV